MQVDLSDAPGARREMLAQSNQLTRIPQLHVNGKVSCSMPQLIPFVTPVESL